MTDLPPTFKKIATEAGVEVAYLKSLDTFIFRRNGITRRVVNTEIEEWTAEQFRTFTNTFTLAKIKSQPIIERILEYSGRSRSPITGHYRS